MNRLARARQVKKPSSRGAIVNIVATAALVVVCTQTDRIMQFFSAPPVTQQVSEVDDHASLIDRSEWWRYMPGVTWQANGLRVHPMNFALVQQDGSGEKPNFPVNTYGVHLEVVGDFALSATMSDLEGVTGSLQLYGQVPIIADEFRIERKSVRMTPQDDMLRVDLWDGTKQDPVITQHFPVTSSDTHKLTIRRHDGFLIFEADGQEVGTIQERDVFDSGRVWIGVGASGDSPTDGWRLSDMRVSEQNGSTVKLADSSTLRVKKQDSDNLQQLASKKRPGFLVGTAVASGPAATDTAYAEKIFGGGFGIVTPENDMKMLNLQPEPGVYDFKKADTFVDMARKHNMRVHGHALVFGEGNPPWFNRLPVSTDAQKKEVERIMLQHIATVIGRYKDNVKSWDVVNEPLMDYVQAEARRGKTGLREHKWLQAMGEQYIIKALSAAHDADPEATLFINEYGLEHTSERWNSFLALARKLKPQLEAQGIPQGKVGVGFQAHEYESRDRIDPDTLTSHIEQLQQLGFKSRISEMDVDLTEGQEVAAQEYANVANACIQANSCVGWSTWIPAKSYNYYINNKGAIAQGGEGLYDDNMQATLAIPAVKTVFIK